MKSINVKEFFTEISQEKFFSLVLIRGDNPYLEKELASIFKKNQFEVEKRTLTSHGPDGTHVDILSSYSLFSSRKVLWLQTQHSHKSWSDTAKEHWKKLVSQVNKEDQILFLQVPTDKRMKWDTLEIPTLIDMGPEAIDKSFWLKRMNSKRGNFLDSDQMHFLLTFDEDLLTLENWVELWSLGGNLWAKKQLQWGERPYQVQSVEGAFKQQPSFAWVDAILKSQPKVAVDCIEKLLNHDSQEALQLLGLISKSAKVLRAIELKLDLTEYPPFLVKKLSPYQGKGERLINLCALLDRKLKSTSRDAEASLVWLSAQC